MKDKPISPPRRTGDVVVTWTVAAYAAATLAAAQQVVARRRAQSKIRSLPPSAAEMMQESATKVEHLWHALSEEMRAFLRSRVPTEADADDLLQDVFLRVHEKLGTLREADRIESWVYQIARNAIADFYRRNTNRSSSHIEDIADPRNVGVPDNQNRAVAAWLPLAIDELPLKLRDAVRMFEIEAVSQAEIANRLGITLSGAKSRVQRGRRRLEELLRGSCEFQLDRRGNVIACEPINENSCMQSRCDCNGDSA